jgi:DNA-binding CsgD family transcriptional regulator
MSSIPQEDLIEQRRRVVKKILTAQEHRVLLMTAEGFTDQEIANHLNVITSTIRIILQRVRDRLEARNRIHCIHIAHQEGLFSGTTSTPDRPDRVPRAPRTPPTGDAAGGGELFTKSADGVYQVKDPISAPVAEPTHYLGAVHPTDRSKTWEIDISVPDDVEARRRMRQLAGWVYPPFLITLRRPGPDGKQIDSLAAFCRPRHDD